MGRQTSLRVTAPSPGYPIHIGEHLLEVPQLFEPYVAKKHIFILSHPDIAVLYLERLKTTCLLAGAAKITDMLIPSGEAQKSLDTATTIWTQCLEKGLRRDAVFIALGGGVIGDLGGFCAGCYQRGIAYIQCPTSLIAQIDAAIGGKTAVNLPGVKNAVGLFYSPQAVVIDTEALITLPYEEYRAGLAELVKYGLGLDPAYFDWIEKNSTLLLNRDPKALHDAIERACALKAVIVSQDSQDQDMRLHLNLGHTVGHALEALDGFQQLRHGEAVSIGMVVAARLSLARRNISKDVLTRLSRLLTRMGLPTDCPPGSTPQALLDRIGFDKKHQTKSQRWVLLNALGQSYIATDVTDDEVLAALETLPDNVVVA